MKKFKLLTGAFLSAPALVLVACNDTKDTTSEQKNNNNNLSYIELNVQSEEQLDNMIVAGIKSRLASQAILAPILGEINSYIDQSLNIKIPTELADKKETNLLVYTVKKLIINQFNESLQLLLNWSANPSALTDDLYNRISEKVPAKSLEINQVKEKIKELVAVDRAQRDNNAILNNIFKLWKINMDAEFANLQIATYFSDASHLVTLVNSTLKLLANPQTAFLNIPISVALVDYINWFIKEYKVNITFEANDNNDAKIRAFVNAISANKPTITLAQGYEIFTKFIKDIQIPNNILVYSTLFLGPILENKFVIENNKNLDKINTFKQLIVDFRANNGRDYTDILKAYYPTLDLVSADVKAKWATFNINKFKEAQYKAISYQTNDYISQNGSFLSEFASVLKEFTDGVYDKSFKVMNDEIKDNKNSVWDLNLISKVSRYIEFTDFIEKWSSDFSDKMSSLENGQQHTLNTVLMLYTNFLQRIFNQQFIQIIVTLVGGNAEIDAVSQKLFEYYTKLQWLAFGNQVNSVYIPDGTENDQYKKVKSQLAATITEKGFALFGQQQNATLVDQLYRQFTELLNNISAQMPQVIDLKKLISGLTSEISNQELSKWYSTFKTKQNDQKFNDLSTGKLDATEDSIGDLIDESTNFSLPASIKGEKQPEVFTYFEASSTKNAEFYNKYVKDNSKLNSASSFLLVHLDKKYYNSSLTEFTVPLGENQTLNDINFSNFDYKFYNYQVEDLTLNTSTLNSKDWTLTLEKSAPKITKLLLNTQFINLDNLNSDYYDFPKPLIIPVNSALKAVLDKVKNYVDKISKYSRLGAISNTDKSKLDEYGKKLLVEDIYQIWKLNKTPASSALKSGYNAASSPSATTQQINDFVSKLNAVKTELKTFLQGKKVNTTEGSTTTVSDDLVQLYNKYITLTSISSLNISNLKTAYEAYNSNKTDQNSINNFVSAMNSFTDSLIAIVDSNETVVASNSKYLLLKRGFEMDSIFESYKTELNSLNSNSDVSSEKKTAITALITKLTDAHTAYLSNKFDISKANTFIDVMLEAKSLIIELLGLLKDQSLNLTINIQ
ncbi:hypothetical protein ACJA23_00610 [Mycoplasma corogypsi]|uniref:hypothetical protein n=1 Tax=Mycoplasma corogypsi TaxID=2106 RepID=UPI003872CE4C